MNSQSKNIQRTYLTLMLGNTLAASLIWGINTLFLLDAGLSNLEAFAANAFFTAGMVLFEVPTGVIADTWGRRTSYLLGIITLTITTVLYYLLWQMSAPFWEWAVVSALLGLGFTFFSGAVEAWLVDALNFSEYTGKLEGILGKGQIVSGVAMLTGSVAGGFIAQISNLGVPFLVRAAILLLMFFVAFRLMKDIGFTPEKSAKPLVAMNKILKNSINHGIKNRKIRWIMLAAPFSSGVGIYAFYAMQPLLLELYGNPKAYGIAGLAAAILAGSQIFGGMFSSKIRDLFHRRTTALALGAIASTVILFAMGLSSSFWIVLVLLVMWGIVFSAVTPIRQTYLNSLIPSKQRATILSFDSLMGSSGGVVAQPVLGRAADVWSYSTSYLLCAGIQAIAIPFILLSRHQKTKQDYAK
jgi:MFS family permease